MNYISEELLDRDYTRLIDKPEIFRYVIVYKDLKKKGRNVRISENLIFLDGIAIYPVFENESFYCKEGIYGVIDQEGDVTYYKCSSVTLRGSSKIDYFIGICSIFGNIALHSGGVTSPYLARYSSEKNLANIEKGNVDENLYAVYRDLVEKGLTPKSGLKYGAHFRAYVSNESRHAEYLIYVIPPYPTYVSLAAVSRVAHAVKKTLVIAKIDAEIEYYEYRWIRI